MILMILFYCLVEQSKNQCKTRPGEFNKVFPKQRILYQMRVKSSCNSAWGLLQTRNPHHSRELNLPLKFLRWLFRPLEGKHEMKIEQFRGGMVAFRSLVWDGGFVTCLLDYADLFPRLTFLVCFWFRGPQRTLVGGSEGTGTQWPFCRYGTSLSSWFTFPFVGMSERLGLQPVHLPLDFPSASSTLGLGVCVQLHEEGPSFCRTPASSGLEAAKMAQVCRQWASAVLRGVAICPSLWGPSFDLFHFTSVFPSDSCPVDFKLQPQTWR